MLQKLDSLLQQNQSSFGLLVRALARRNHNPHLPLSGGERPLPAETVEASSENNDEVW